MTRFSPEYINYILSDEASVLQEQWKKRGVRKGDWAWDAGTETGKVRLVTSTATHTDSLDFVLEGTAKRWTAEVDWLPTLSDLLGMIEANLPSNKAAEISFSIEPGKTLPSTRLYPHPFEPDNITHRKAYHSNTQWDGDAEPIAAKLAVRVLEEKEQPR